MRELEPKSLQQEVDENKEAKVETHDTVVPLTEEQNRLIEQGCKQVEIVAKVILKEIKNKRNTDLGLKDFISWGQDGLIDAVRKFDPEKGKFATYAEYRIRGGIRDGLRNFNYQNSISRGHLKFIKYNEKVIESLQRELNRKPTIEEIAQKMNLTPCEYFKKLKEYPLNIGVFSLTEFPNNNDHTEKDYFLDKILQEINPSSRAEDNKEYIIELLNKFLDSLGEKERKIFDMYFGEELSMHEVAEKLNLTEGGISRIIKNKIIKKAKEFFERRNYKVSHENKRFITNRPQKKNS